MSYAHCADALHRLHAAPPVLGDPWPPRWEPGVSVTRWLAVGAGTLTVAAFRIERWGQTFVSRGRIVIALDALPRERLRVVAVHDFRIEDDDSNLRRACAGVFLARCIAGRWEAPEDGPLECRALAVLGEVDVARGTSSSPV